jgi:hypothetical protein
MSWYHKEAITPFDQQPPEGLFYLDGDILAALLGRAWTTGMKYPMVSFPSETAFELWENNILHLFGEMDLPLESTRDEGYAHANAIAKLVGYLAFVRGENRLEVIGPDEGEHLLLTYDNQQPRIVDIFHLVHLFVQRPLEILDDTSRAKLPPLYSGETLGMQALAQVKFFTPDAHWIWYASEFDGNNRFFGLVIGDEIEVGYFSLEELTFVRGPLGLPVERDPSFSPTTLADLKAKHEQERKRD